MTSEKLIGTLGIILLIVLSLSVVSTPVYSQESSSTDTGAEILKTVDKNLIPDNVTFYRKIINIEPDGSRKEFVLFTAKKGEEKVVSLFLSPPADRGRATLRIDENMWLYIPSVKKPVRITSLQSVTGGIFDNADIMRLDYAYEYSVETFEDRGDTYFLRLRAKTDAVAYDRLDMWVDPGSMTPTKIDSYTASDMLIKTLRFKNIEDFGNGIVRPAVIETTSPLHEGYVSRMIFQKFQPRKIADRYFTTSGMDELGDVR